ncbi:UNVERIFIED_CONTAM: cytochrome [Sesamum latifolium]|uniref:Cytochrome n=1 Tax=Sesamum latifolium TaxID=2727402 RepID=A0AAW2TZ93_9LAMI
MSKALICGGRIFYQASPRRQLVKNSRGDPENPRPRVLQPPAIAIDEETLVRGLRHRLRPLQRVLAGDEENLRAAPVERHQGENLPSIREDEVSRLVQKLSEHASRAETINMTERITFLTSTIICRVAFGKRYEHGTGESKEFNHIIREFQNEISAFHFTDYFPWLGWLDKVLGKIDELERVYKKWDLFYQQLLDEHQQPDRPKSMDGDVVDIMLQLRKDRSFELSLDHVKAVLMVTM